MRRVQSKLRVYCNSISFLLISKFRKFFVSVLKHGITGNKIQLVSRLEHSVHSHLLREEISASLGTVVSCFSFSGHFLLYKN